MRALIRSNTVDLRRKLRQRRAVHFLQMIDGIAQRQGKCSIVDLGGTVKYWTLFDRAWLTARNVHITIVNNEPSERCDDPLFTLVEGDACDLAQFADMTFDLVHSNSVIEHLGLWSSKEAFAGEVHRLAPAFYVQTPNYWFPMEPHWMVPFIHWRSEKARVRWIMRNRANTRDNYGLAMRAVQSISLLDKTEMRALFPGADHKGERFAGLTKSLLALRTGWSDQTAGG